LSPDSSQIPSAELTVCKSVTGEMLPLDKGHFITGFGPVKTGPYKGLVHNRTAVGADAHIGPQDAERCFYGTAANP
ncbi:MAG: hypothetical protein ACI3W5_06095, partial [Faecousia sp.]